MEVRFCGLEMKANGLYSVLDVRVIVVFNSGVNSRFDGSLARDRRWYRHRSCNAVWLSNTVADGFMAFDT